MAPSDNDRSRSPDLTPADWLDAGQSLLRRGGLRALKLRPLAAELRVSTGSFYHHFVDFHVYQGQLAAHFAGSRLTAILGAIRQAEADPIARIHLLADTVRRRGLSRLSIAMRAWAESDPRARAAVERCDEAVIGFLAECLQANGLARNDAMVRAYALMTLGLSKVHAPEVDRTRLMGALIPLLCHPMTTTAAAAAQEESVWRPRHLTISS